MARLTRFARERRTRFIPGGAYGEPAWEALLVLYTQRHAGSRMTIEELAASTSASRSAALRWIDYLQSEGMIERDADTQASHVDLSTLGRARMDKYFGCIWDAAARGVWDGEADVEAKALDQI